MAELKKIKIKAIPRKTKDGKEFISYRAVQNDGKLIDCRFTRDVKNAPEKTSYVMVDPSQMNISYSYEYPRLWIKRIEEIIPIENEEINNICDLF